MPLPDCGAGMDAGAGTREAGRIAIAATWVKVVVALREAKLTWKADAVILPITPATIVARVPCRPRHDRNAPRRYRSSCYASERRVSCTRPAGYRPSRSPSCRPAVARRHRGVYRFGTIGAC